jgi:hypothetical protein
MTARERLFESTVVDGGALGAAAIDVATRTVVAGFAHEGLAPPALVDLLLGTTPPVGPLTQLCGGPPPSAVRELMITGAHRALYCTVVDRGELIIVATPSAMSVALGWALLRALAVAERDP